MSPSATVAQSIVLILGAGPNIGSGVAKKFASNGYKVVLSSRKTPADGNAEYSFVKGDLSEPSCVADIFSQVRELYGQPSVVVYNAGAVTYAPKENTFTPDLKAFQNDLNINTVSTFMAVKEALVSFASLPSSASRTFIYTGNAMNFASFDGLLTLGVGKSASAHMISSAATAFADKGYKFYYADERQESGKLVGKGISGEAHGDIYAELADGKAQGPWLQTFVKGKGYVNFPTDTVVTF